MKILQYPLDKYSEALSERNSAIHLMDQCSETISRRFPLRSKFCNETVPEAGNSATSHGEAPSESTPLRRKFCNIPGTSTVKLPLKAPPAGESTAIILWKAHSETLSTSASFRGKFCGNLLDKYSETQPSGRILQRH